ncbi:hypothetical protein DPMN_073923 [Dreissena polymorpha]|uniref:Uncharacterized protein n=1 Tax=Dreissena polymorpha TaxID=45954 RepID=A0A9D3YE02_DREPO|nr:hypothetical protein DPMN_073923 [Dreissena polymorpha]
MWPLELLTRFYYGHIRKNAPTLGSHVFQANVPIFELIQDIIETNLLTKFHEDWKINVASRELTRQVLMPHDGQWTTDKSRSQKLSAFHRIFVRRPGADRGGSGGTTRPIANSPLVNSPQK